MGTLREWAEREFQSSDVILVVLLVLIFGLAMFWGEDNLFIQDLVKMAMGGALVYIQKDADRGR